jgi:prepilin-type N-terminal cleavage/methylation domain-containing protein
MRTQSQPICSLDLRPAALRGPRPSSDSGVRLSPPRPTRFHRPVGPGARLGFTLIEIIIALTLLSIVGAAAVTFLVKETRAVMVTAGRLDAQQNVSFAMDAISHDLRVAGVGLGLRQPMIIEAHPYAISFNADLVTSDTASVTAASYFDPSVPDSLALALTPANKIAYPYGAISYPDSTYVQATGLLSNAETITYYFTLDSTTARTDDYLLLRRVNSAPPSLLARGLIFPGGVPGFRFFIPGAAVNSRVEVIAPTLPLYFQEGSVGPDTMLAKISEVRVQLEAVYTDPIEGDVHRSANENVPLLNAGLSHLQACASPPAAPVSITPTAWPSGDSIGLTWPASTDEIGGKRDVKSYSLYRRIGAAGSWNTPIYTSPADGTPTYAWEDKAVPLGQTYAYGIVSRDCTPSLSALTVAGGTVSPSP